MKKYKKHFDMQSEINEKGKVTHRVVYKGEYYQYDLEEPKQKTMKLLYVGILALITLIIVGMGLINNPGSRRLEITIPYVVCYLPLVYAWLAVFRIWVAPKRMDYVDYDKGCVRLKKSTIGMLVFGMLTLVGELIFWVLDENGFSLHSEWLFLMGGLFFALILLVFLQLQRRFPCISEKKI